MKKIKLFENTSLYTRCICDGCKEIINTKYGDTREEVFKITPEGEKYDFRLLCPTCIDELFTVSEPDSIFD